MAERALNPAAYLYMGRNTVRDGVCWLGWSASSLGFETDAKSVTLSLCTDAAPLEPAFRCRGALLLDGGCARVFMLQGDEELRLPLDGNVHRVELVRLSEAAFGALGVRAIHADGEVRALKKPRRTIEFIGDSITCGYGVEAGPADTFSTSTENPLEAYAYLAAKELGCGYSLVSWSGIGLISDWVPDTAVSPDTTVLMPSLYPLENMRLYERLGAQSPAYDFAGSQIDAVVINLGTNDQSWVRGIKDREADFERAYRAFLAQVQACRPGCPILCTLGVMGTSLCAAAERAANAYEGTAFLPLPEQVPRDGLGADSHPSKITQQKTAALVAKKLRELNWL